jgi:quercetin dioxygenase-like cupin family protein
MEMTGFPFTLTDWSTVEADERPGETGWTRSCTAHFGAIRVRMVEYSPGYLADHWCSKGHVLLCLEGELTVELEGGRRAVLKPGMTYQVADGADPHRSHTAAGAKLFIVD